MTSWSQESSGLQTLRELWRLHRLSFVVTASLVFVIGVFLLFTFLPDTYRAETVAEWAPDETAAPYGERDFASEIQSPSVLSAAVTEMERLPADASSSQQHRTMEELARTISVSTARVPGGPTEIRISSRSVSRESAALTADCVAQAWVASRVKQYESEMAKLRQLEDTAGTLEKDVTEALERMKSAESALGTFETEQAGALAEAHGDFQTAQSQLAAELRGTQREIDRMRTELAGLEAAAIPLREKLKTVPEFIKTQEVTTKPDPRRTALEDDIRLMRRQLEEMLQTYTFRHPEVQRLQNNILLKQRELRELTGRVQDSVRSTENQNPEYAVFKARLEDTEVRLNTTRGSIERLVEKQRELEKHIDSFRQLSERHQALRTDLAAARRQHEEASKALEEKKQTFDSAKRRVEPAPRIVQAATIPTEVTGPPKPPFVLGVLFLAALFGALGMSATSRLGTTFAGSSELARLTRLPLVGTLGAIRGTEAAGRRKRREKVGLILSLAMPAAALLAVGLMLLHRAATLQAGG